jgi:hypothetical protein
MGTSLLEPRLLEDAVQCARGKIVIRLPGNGHLAWLRRVLVLSMAATRGGKVPAIILKLPENLADFHAIILSKQFKVSNTIGITPPAALYQNALTGDAPIGFEMTVQVKP